MTTDLLEERLRDLSFDTPDAGRVTARVLSRRHEKRASRAPRFAAMVAALLLIVVGVIYFVPAADLALANVPVAGDALHDAGLVGARDRITYVGTETTSSGYRLKLVAAYADSTRTVLLMHADPTAFMGGSFTELTDQFARTYRITGGSGNILTGDFSMQFEPLAWPDAITGARITLHMTELDTATLAGPGPRIAGTWTLPALIRVDQANALPIPAPADLGPAHFRFTSVTYTPATIAVDMVVSGVSPEELGRNVPGYGGNKGAPALMTFLIDPQGQVINGNGEESGDAFGSYHVRWLGFRLGGAGRYTIRVSLYGEGEFERVITIP